MFTIRYLIFILILFLHVHFSFSQPTDFTHYSIDQGLSQSVVKCIYQDSHGYIWFGTQQGLNKFNGYTFEKYTNKPSDSTSISDNWIYSITEDRDSNILVGTRNGLNKFLIRTGKFQRYLHNDHQKNSIFNNFVYGVTIDNDGNILASTPPVLNIINSKTIKVDRYLNNIEVSKEISDEGRPIVQTKDGNIWMATCNGLWNFNLSTKKFQVYDTSSKAYQISNNDITALYEDPTNNLWVGTQSGLNKIDLISHSISTYYIDTNVPLNSTANFIRSIIIDSMGHLWVGTDGSGLNRLIFDPNYQIIDKTIYHSGPENSGELSHNIILSLFIDKSKILWIGTLNGINKTDLKKKKFNIYRKDKTQNSIELLDNVIASVLKDKDRIWIGNWGGGLNIFNRQDRSIKYYTSQLTGKNHISDNFIHTIYKDSKNRIWVGTRDMINMYDENNQEFISFQKFFKTKKLPSFENIRVNDILEDYKGFYWIGTQNGLFKLDLRNFKYEVFNAGSSNKNITNNLVYELLEDSNKNLWIATSDGLNKYDPNSDNFIHFKRNPHSSNTLCSDFIISLCEDSEKNIWIGTSSGLNKYIIKDSVFVNYSESEGLSSNIVYEIVMDKYKNLWYATVGGLSQYNSKLKKFRSFDIEDGLQSLEFNTSKYHAEDGEIFFGGMNGVNYFYPDSFKNNNFIPQVVITLVEKSSSDGKQIIAVDKYSNIILEHRDYSFTIEFASLEFTNPLKNRYAYKINGFNNNWIELGNRRFVSFSNLPAGDYVFQVKGSNNDGVWNEKGAVLNFKVLPAWWKSTIAYILYFILFSISIIFIVKYRESDQKKQKLILEKKVEERTCEVERQKTEITQQRDELGKLNATKDKFFSIIAHDLKNPFHILLGITEMLKNNFQEYPNEKKLKYIENIIDISKNSYQLLEDLLSWSRSQTGNIQFNPEKLDIKTIISDVVYLLQQIADKKEIVLVNRVNQSLIVYCDKNSIESVIRNLISNALKFTNKSGKVIIESKSVIIDNNEKYIEISIIDNGIGISEEKIQKLFQIDQNVTSLGTNKEKGTGLGLLLCKEFVEKNGGKIWLTSELGKGSTFYFTIPV